MSHMDWWTWSNQVNELVELFQMEIKKFLSLSHGPTDQIQSGKCRLEMDLNMLKMRNM